MNEISSILVEHFWQIAGSVLAACFLGYLAWRNNRINRLTAASDILRATFNPALAFLDQSRLHGDKPDSPDANTFLRDAFVSHDAAVRQFRPFVGRMRRRAYDKAWQQYCELNPADPDSGVMFMVSNRVDPEGAVQERIHAILLFAKT